MLEPGMTIHVGGTKISLDTPSGEMCYVSHAHGDHVSALRLSKPIIASEETLALRAHKASPHSHPRVKLMNAGHILGSTQLFAELDGGTFAYTGDFKINDGLTTKGAEVRQCDSLLIESTYGSPEFRFPKREGVFDDMEKWVKSHPEAIRVFGGYSVGKAQEIIKFLNVRCGIAPVVDRKIEQMCAVYEKYGVKLDRIPTGTPEADEVMRSAFVAVMPHQLVNYAFAEKLAEAHNRKVLTALATGWAMKYAYSVHRLFPLSDHADFYDVLEYVVRASPKMIFCCHGDSKGLAAELRKRGFNAQGYEEKKEKQAVMQTTLA